MTKANPKAYKAPHAVYTGGKLYKPGEPFVTDDPKGEHWEQISKEEKAAAEAADPTVHEDPPLEGLGIQALRAIAVTKKVNPKGLSDDELISAIKAADEPSL